MTSRELSSTQLTPLLHTPTAAKLDWSTFYEVTEEELPPHMPELLGYPVNDAGNLVTQRLHSDILLFVQKSPIFWLSRQQNTEDTSIFGSEFVAFWTARDRIISVRYKLRMFGIPIEGPAQASCDNQGDVKNASHPESALTKKHNAINYHAVREAAASGVLGVIKDDTAMNPADLFTMVFPADRRRELLGSIRLYNLV
jgi:hypothetical protein